MVFPATVQAARGAANVKLRKSEKATDTPRGVAVNVSGGADIIRQNKQPLIFDADNVRALKRFPA